MNRIEVNTLRNIMIDFVGKMDAHLDTMEPLSYQHNRCTDIQNALLECIEKLSC